MCYAEAAIINSPHPKYTLGCVSSKICKYFINGTAVIGRRSLGLGRQPRATHLCQKCCSTSGCNADLCDDRQTIYTPGITGTTTGSLQTTTGTTTGSLQTTTQTIPPRISTTAPLPVIALDCNFEDDRLCGFEQLKLGDRFDWTLRSGRTPSSNTGPLHGDHTFGTVAGHYLYIEASGRRAGDNAIISLHVPPSPESCLEFYYNMDGVGIGTLNVHVKSLEQQTTKIWSMTGNQGHGWKRGLVPVNNFSTIFYEGITTGSILGDISIDDVLVTTRTCQYEGFSCDFESSLCGFTQLKTENFDWRLHNGTTPTVHTGPNVDHTLGSPLGHYLYLDASGRKKLDKAIIVSPTMSPSDGLCLEFYYMMYGVNVNRLTVYVTSATEKRAEWSRLGNLGNKWLYNSVPIKSQTNFTISFEGVVGGLYGDIAIDDLKLEPCHTTDEALFY